MATLTDIVADTTNFFTEKENRGKPVKAVAYGGQIINRIVWEESHGLVYLCSQRCYDQLCAGDMSRRPVGFPREDVTGI